MPRPTKTAPNQTGPSAPRARDESSPQPPTNAGHSRASWKPKGLRVLHVVKTLGLGGTEKAMQLMAQHLDRSLFAPFVYSPVDGPRREPLRRCGVPVITGLGLLEAMERVKPQIVHVHRAGWPEPQLLSPIRRFGPKAVVETNVFGRLDDSPLEAVIDRHLFISHFCLARLMAVHGPKVDAKKYQVLHYPVDTDLFARLTPAQDFTRPWAGRLSRADPGKWSRLVFDMLPILAQARPDFNFLVIGATPEFQAYAKELALTDRVRCLDPVSTDEDLAAFFGRVSLLAHANDTGESFGLAIAEAMAAGLPVVTHPAQGLRDNAQLELVEHQRTGLVATTAQEYAQAVLRLWDNPDEAKRLGQAGREKAQTFFRAQVIAKALGDIYLELMDR